MKVKGHTSNYRTKNIPVKHGMLINQTKELQATDYHLFSSDEELEKALSSPDRQDDLSGTLMSFHNVRSNIQHKKINRLHPETIESTTTMQRHGGEAAQMMMPASCFNSGGKSSLKKK